MFSSKTDEELFQEQLENLFKLMEFKNHNQLLEDILYEIEGDDFFFNEDNVAKAKDVKNKVISGAKLAKRTVSHKINKTGEHIDTLIKATKQHIIGESREEIMTNHTKVSTIIKRILTTGAIAYINPVIGLLYLFIKMACKEKLKTREREKILADLKLELEICEEKINDATNAGDKKKKYELMRLRNELKKSILRLQNAGRGIRNIG